MPAGELIKFVKMHGLGNDFVIIDTITHGIDTEDFPVKDWSDRHFGIGFDQLILIEPSNIADFYCRIYNADGSEAEHCGNGLRCVGRYIWQAGQVRYPTITLETKAGKFTVEVNDYHAVRLSMGKPKIIEKYIEYELNRKNVGFSILSMGNPHAIVPVENIKAAGNERLVKEVVNTPHFVHHGANVGFMQIVDKSNILLRTFERGVGETNACGSNACAAVYAGIINDWLDNEVKVKFKHGDLKIAWQEGQLYMIGPADWVYTGEIYV